jgi:hypothetical protein
MIALIWFVLAVLVSPFKSKSRLEAENAAPRHPLIVLRRKMPGRPWLTNNDRWFFLQIYRWFRPDLSFRYTQLFFDVFGTLIDWRAAHQEAVHMVDQIERQLRKRLLPYTYRHFGSLVPLGNYSTVRNFICFLLGRSIFVERLLSRVMNRSLRVMHERPVTVFYVPRLACSHAVCRDVLGRSTNGRPEHHAHAQ